MKRAVIAVLGALACTSCFRTTVRAGAPPGDSPAGYHERWHSGWVAGLIEGSGPHHLEQLCPGGWAQIDTKTEPVDLVVMVTTIFIYTPQVITISCRDPRDQTRVAKGPPNATYPVQPSPNAPPPASLEAR
jgi:hypothetical protein